MAAIPEPVQDLINAFSLLPGIGPRTASRLTFYLLKHDDDVCLTLSDALKNLHVRTDFCKECFNITVTGQDLCDICRSGDRRDDILCVVESPMDVIALEQTNAYHGKYHVLHGLISAIEGILPEDIHINELCARVLNGNFSEVIIATNPSMEGDFTFEYIKNRLLKGGFSGKISMLARGMPSGGELEYADQTTLKRALDGRQ